MRTIHSAMALSTLSLATGVARSDFLGWTAKVQRVTGGFRVNVFAATDAANDSILAVGGEPTGYVRTTANGGFIQGNGTQQLFAPAGSQNWTTLDSFLTVGGSFQTTTGRWLANGSTQGGPAWNMTYFDTDTGETLSVSSFSVPSNESGFANPNINSIPPGCSWSLTGTSSSPARSLTNLGARDFSSSTAAASAQFGMLVAQLYVSQLTRETLRNAKVIEWNMSATIRRSDGSLSSGLQSMVISSPVCLKRQLSGELAPFDYASPRNWTATGIGSTYGEARVRITARGNLGTSTRFLNLRADGVLVATGIFGANSGSGNCLAQASVADITIPGPQFASMAADGSIQFRIEPSLNASSQGCQSPTLSLQLEYDPGPADCNDDGTEDACEIATNPAVIDCNSNGLVDACEISNGAADVNQNGVLDTCEADCNANALPDGWEIAQGISPDCNGNSKPDSCDIASGHSADLDGNGIPDSCQPDCNANAVPDGWETAQGLTPDCNSNNRPDSCDIAEDPLIDCNVDGVIDSCQGNGPEGADCNGNGIYDVCELAGGAEDKNSNGKLDSCEIARGDLNLDGSIDGIDLGGLLSVWGAQNPPYGDLNGDGWVDGIDLGILLARWGPVP